MKTAILVVDTNVFINPDSRHFFGQNPSEAFLSFLRQLESKRGISCYMPPSVYEELMKFLEIKLPTKNTILINKKPPASYQTQIPALFLYEFIEEIRNRINKGLRIAEKYSRRVMKLPLGQTEEEIIKSLRQEYRTALREGIIDSKEDFDLILLAKDLNAHLVTSDNGLIRWAQKLGIHCLSAEELKHLLES